MSGAPIGQQVGRFVGKTVFGSARGGVYLTTRTIKREGLSALQLPAMAATTLSDQERCILYAQPDGSLRIQMASLLWVALNPDLGWLVLTANFSEAAAFVFQGEPPGQRWQVRTPTGLATVTYTVGNTSPILTTRGSSGDPDSFLPLVITPSLAQIRQAKACHDGDFRHVDFSGEDLSGVDFTGAKFGGAILTGVIFDGATLTRSSFGDAALAGIRCNGAILDRADFDGANLNGVAWGSPASAREIVLTNCQAAGAVLGGQANPLDCTGASLAGSNFTGADLRGLILDNGNLQGIIAVGAKLRGCSLRGVNGQGANLVRADLSAANLTRAKLGAKAYLFSVAGAVARALDEKPYVQPDLVQAFGAQGVKLSPEDRVAVIAAGKRWRVQDSGGPYLLLLSPAGGIDVFSERADLRPAVLRGAICEGTKAPGASMSGVDMRGVLWYGQGATLDHADLEGASLVGSLLVETDFSQAYLAGSDLSGCVLVQAKFRGCLLGPSENRQPFSLEGSWLQGADFRDATLLGALLVDAAVALPRGVPLFSLPLGAEKDLNQQGIAGLAPAFTRAGRPLGSDPTLAKVQIWLLENPGETDSPRVYQVKLVRNDLRVFDGETGSYLFQLPPGDLGLLANKTPPPALVAAFNQSGYSLDPQATISTQGYWEISDSVNPEQGGPDAYPIMRVYPGADTLPVYGSVSVQLRDWPQYPEGIAFTATNALDGALNATSLGPSGYPRAWVDQGILDWETFLRRA
jgi:uncharacterized protein YjbI with pentapeptide repeats